MSYIDVLNDAANRADAASTKAEGASQLLEDIANGPVETYVTTLNGQVPTAATAIAELRSEIAGGATAPIIESVTLTSAGQANVTFNNLQTSGLAAYIDEGSGAYRYFNFTVDGTNSIILGDSFQAGTIVWGVAQEIGGDVQTAVQQTQANAQLAEDWAILTGETVDGIEYSSKKYAQDSSASASAAATSETNAAASESSAATSASNAATSESNAAQSASAASTSETNAASSAVDALSSKNAAATSASNASSSASAAATSETNAASSASAALTSEQNAAASESAALTSEQNAASSASEAQGFANDSSNSAELSKDWATLTTGTVDGTEYSSKYYAQQASSSASSAATSESNAATSASNALASENAAALSESAAAQSEMNASGSAADALASANVAAQAEQSAVSAAQQVLDGNYVNGGNISHIVTLTLADYDVLDPVDPNTLYIIEDD